MTWLNTLLSAVRGHYGCPCYIVLNRYLTRLPVAAGFKYPAFGNGRSLNFQYLSTENRRQQNAQASADSARLTVYHIPKKVSRPSPPNVKYIGVLFSLPGKSCFGGTWYLLDVNRVTAIVLPVLNRAVLAARVPRGIRLAVLFIFFEYQSRRTRMAFLMMRSCLAGAVAV